MRFGCRKRFKWTVEHDTYILREMLTSEIWLSKAGSSERGEGWKKLADLLNRKERVRLDISARSVREHFQVLYDKRRAKNREEGTG